MKIGGGGGALPGIRQKGVMCRVNHRPLSRAPRVHFYGGSRKLCLGQRGWGAYVGRGRGVIMAIKCVASIGQSARDSFATPTASQWARGGSPGRIQKNKNAQRAPAALAFLQNRPPVAEKGHRWPTSATGGQVSRAVLPVPKPLMSVYET